MIFDMNSTTLIAIIQLGNGEYVGMYKSNPSACYTAYDYKYITYDKEEYSGIPIIS